MDVNYKNSKRYKTAKYPIRQPWYLKWLIWILSKILLMGKKHKVEKIGMEGLKPPYMLLSNHMAFIDFELIALGTRPYRVNNVVNIDGYYRRPWLLTWIGSICTRKFTTDFHLVKSIRHVLKRGDILCMYPEARYSPCGITSFLPDSLGKLIKMNKVPVVVAIHHGNYLHAPVWNVPKKRRVPLHTTMKLLFTAEETQTLSVDELNARLKEAFIYDEYSYQRENGIRITEPYRAEGMHKILYKCPHCMTESKMATKGTELYCEACGKRWTLGEDGTLTANEGETEFSHVPDWFLWEREEVRREIENGTYSFSDTVDVHSMPRCWNFESLGEATLTHDEQHGFVLSGHYRGRDYRIERAPLQNNSLHVEYDFPHIKPYDCVDISTENDSFYCFPSKQNVVTKLAFATEIIYERAYARVRKH
ncbi:MAG: 1-acyl-sn-glycerol-3-phosphate acyltransferase [Ruminococcaceae bacterium]|nr:1-acyl-sn-glycerol-3-phosphate acyltransferase [Oscillospiraceae bacterium]